MSLGQRRDFGLSEAQQRILQPVITYPTPNIQDKVLVEDVLLDATYTPVIVGCTRKGATSFRLVAQKEVVGDGDKLYMRRVWATSQTAQDTHNLIIGYLSDSATAQTYVRHYMLLKSDGEPTLTPGTTLTSLVGLALTAGGSGYTTAPTISFTGGAGTGATAIAQIRDGSVIAIQLTASGTGYTSAPTVVFSSGAATATAIVQSQTAYLISQKAPPAEGELGSLFYDVQRVWQVLPGPVLVTSGYDPTSGRVVKVTRQAVLTSTVPATADLLDAEINGYDTPKAVTSVVNGLVYCAGNGLAAGDEFFLNGLTLNTLTMTGGSTIEGSTILTVASTFGFHMRSNLTGTGIPAGCTVLRIISATQIEMTYAATATNSGLTITSTDELGMTLGDTGGAGAYFAKVVGVTATATVTVFFGGVLTVNVVNGGGPYPTVPLVVISGDGTGAVATAILTGGVVTGFTVNNPGSGYTSATATIAPAPFTFSSISGGDVNNAPNSIAGGYLYRRTTPRGTTISYAPLGDSSVVSVRTVTTVAIAAMDYLHGAPDKLRLGSHEYDWPNVLASAQFNTAETVWNSGYSGDITLKRQIVEGPRGPSQALFVEVYTSNPNAPGFLDRVLPIQRWFMSAFTLSAVFGIVVNDTPRTGAQDFVIPATLHPSGTVSINGTNFLWSAPNGYLDTEIPASYPTAIPAGWILVDVRPTKQEHGMWLYLFIYVRLF